MNRSVISVTIAAGLLFAGTGAITATTAGASPDRSVGTDDAGSEATDQAGATARRGPRIPFRDPGGGTPPAPCPHAPGPFVESTATSGPAGNRGLGQIPVPPAPRVPVAVLAGGVERGLPETPAVLDLATVEVPVLDALPPPATRPVSAPPGAPVSVRQPQPLPSAPGGPAARLSVPPGARAAGPQMPSADSAPAGPSRHAGPVGVVPDLRGGLPDVLGLPNSGQFGNADVVGMLARALPGLAAILGMTALGAVVGYRQAKAGQMLPALGAGRFLR